MREVLGETEPAVILILDSQTLEWLENGFLLFKPPNLWDFVMTAPTNLICLFHGFFLFFFFFLFQNLASVQFSSVAQPCPTLQPHELQHARPLCPSPAPGVHSESRPSSQ